MGRRRPRVAASAEHGAVLVMFAVFAPVAILFLSFSLDLGNTYWHARHLQAQADASALAAAQEFQPCNDNNIYRRAGQYGGAAHVANPSTPGTPAESFTPFYNTQIGGNAGAEPKNMKLVINSKTYYPKPYSPGSSPHVDRTAVEKPPCEAEMVDVKVTEEKLPWYVKVFKSAFNGVLYDNAHARVELVTQTEPSDLAPLAIAESAPIAASAYFVNEDEGNGVAAVENGKALASVPLENTGPNGNGQETWTNAKLSELTLAITKPHIGVVIALSGTKAHTKCGEAFVKCFDGPTGPLLHIAGYSDEGAGTLTKPIARKVTLSAPPGDTCTDGYFSNSSTTCTLGLEAKVDYGSTNRKGVTVTPEINGKTGPALEFNESTGLWQIKKNAKGEPEPVALNGAGSNEITLVVKCKSETGSACATQSTEGKATNVQRAYAASEAGSGTIAGVWIGEVGGALQDANSFEVCEPADKNECTHKLTVTVSVAGSLANAQRYLEKPQRLRAGSSTGEVVGCTGREPSGNLYEQHLAEGCNFRYKINTSDPNCTVETEPYDCIGKASGFKAGPFRAGLSSRFESAPPAGSRYYCPNNWTKNNGENTPLIPKDDSRVIQLFVEPYDAAVTSQGSAPIQDFATFYVYSWDGDTCKSDEKGPNGESTKAGKGEVIGYFIKYINTLNTKEGGGQKCVLNSLEECTTVLTR